MKTLDALCRRSAAPLVAASVRGSCGFVFNDFHSEFVVEDVDGELYKEVTVDHDDDNVYDDGEDVDDNGDGDDD